MGFFSRFRTRPHIKHTDPRDWLIGRELGGQLGQWIFWRFLGRHLLRGRIGIIFGSVWFQLVLQLFQHRARIFRFWRDSTGVRPVSDRRRRREQYRHRHRHRDQHE